MEGQTRLHSRLSTLSVFNKFATSNKPPVPPPKDKWYLQNSASTLSLAPSAYAPSTSGASTGAASQNTLKVSTQMALAASKSQSDLTRSASPSPSTSTMTPSASGHSSVGTHSSGHSGGGSSFRRQINKLSSFGKRPKFFMRSNSSKSTLLSSELSVSEDGILVESPSIDGDAGISAPWNVQHHLHVDEGLSGLPPEWIDALRAKGESDIEIVAARRRNRTTYLQDHPDLCLSKVSRPGLPPSFSSPSVTSLSSSASLARDALPTRSASLSSHTDGASSPSSPSISTPISTSPTSPIRQIPLPPSSYHQPTLIRAPSRSDSLTQGTATATGLSRRPSRPDRPLPPPSDEYEQGAPLPPSTPPRRFRVVNADPGPGPGPGSPPPAYGQSDSSRSKALESVGDVKVRQREEQDEGSNGRILQGNDDRANLAAERIDGIQDGQGGGFAGTESTRTTASDDIEASYAPPQRQLSRKSSGVKRKPPPLVLRSTRDAAPDVSSVSATNDESIQQQTPSPSESPISRATVLPPRLSLHQDMDSDLSSWSETLFSVMKTGDVVNAFTPQLTPNSAQTVSKNYLTAPGRSSNPSSTLSSPSPSRSVSTDTDSSTPDPTMPLFDEVMNLVQSPIDAPSVYVPLSRPASEYLPSPPPHHTLDPDVSNHAYAFLSQSYNPDRNSGMSIPSSRDSQATISNMSRWSKATIVRDATIARVTRPEVANIGASSATPSPQAYDDNTADYSNDMSSDLSMLPSASDFPMPPPSPMDAAFMAAAYKSASQVNLTQTNSNLPSTGAAESLPSVCPSSPITHPLPSPTSPHSSDSSSLDSSTSSGAKHLSVVSYSDTSNEGMEEHHEAAVRLASAVRVEFPFNAAGKAGNDVVAKGVILSPTDSESSRGWPDHGTKVEKAVENKVAVYSDEDDYAEGLYYDEEVQSPMVDWLTDSPLDPRYEASGNVKRDSITVYNHLNPGQDAQGLSPHSPAMRRPSIQIGAAGTESRRHLSPASGSGSLSPSPISSSGTSPMARYRGWVSEVLAPLEDFIDHHTDPRDLFANLQEVAEGESGSVFSARIVGRLRPGSKKIIPEDGSMVTAIKSIPLVPGGSQKLTELRKELLLMSCIRHDNILSMDALYVDLSEDSLWIKMELMERSLADMLQLAEEGFMLHEITIAQFAGDTLQALAYLERIGIAHRDVRSDNLLINSEGVLKLADFSHAIQVDTRSATSSEAVGVLYWQAPEMRTERYDTRKVDVWSTGATVWEMAETDPPFMDIEDPHQVPDTLPTLSNPEKYSPSFHEFLSLTSSPPSSRPSANELLTTSFIRSGCGRPFVKKVLAQCKDIEDRIHRRQSLDSQGTVS